jgi:hypothetical protein
MAKVTVHNNEGGRGNALHLPYVDLKGTDVASSNCETILKQQWCFLIVKDTLSPCR